jgi:serine/threonine protein kinase
MNIHMPQQLLNKYTVISTIAKGSNGDVFEVQNINDQKRYVAKLEKCNSCTVFGLYNEQRVLKYLHWVNTSEELLVQKLHEFDEIVLGENKCYFMITDQLGPNLNQIYQNNKSVFTLRFVANIGI